MPGRWPVWGRWVEGVWRQQHHGPHPIIASARPEPAFMQLAHLSNTSQVHHNFLAKQYQTFKTASTKHQATTSMPRFYDTKLCKWLPYQRRVKCAYCFVTWVHMVNDHPNQLTDNYKIPLDIHTPCWTAHRRYKLAKFSSRKDTVKTESLSFSTHFPSSAAFFLLHFNSTGLVVLFMCQALQTDI